MFFFFFRLNDQLQTRQVLLCSAIQITRSHFIPMQERKKINDSVEDMRGGGGGGGGGGGYEEHLKLNFADFPEK